MVEQSSAPAHGRGDERAAPSEAFITAIRRRFPVEDEIDRVMTRKMRARTGPAYSAIPLARLAQGTQALIRSQSDAHATLSNARWLHGGASKLQMAFDLDWCGGDGGARRTTPMVLRMEPPEAIVETSRLREFEMLALMSDTVPVPPCYWLDADAAYLPHPAIIYGYVAGVSKPADVRTRQVTGVGTNFGPGLRAPLATQFINALAAIHTVPAERLAALRAFEPATVGSNTSIVRQVHWWRRVWEEDRPEDLPLVNVATHWLLGHAPALDHVSVVHGDFRAGNFLFSEATAQVTAWLDWELAVLGDRHQDLAWASSPHFGHFAEDGTTFLASGLLPTPEFLERYEQCSGLCVDVERLRYFRIFNDFTTTVHMLATAWRVARYGKTHQDVLVAWLAMIGHLALAQLRHNLAEVLK